MAKVTPLKALSSYFNEGEGVSVGGTLNGVELPYGRPAKRPVRDFAAECKALSETEKAELVSGVLAVTGDTL